MSFTLYLKDMDCPICQQDHAVFNFRYSYDIAPFWYNIYPNDEKAIDIDEMKGSEAVKKLEHALLYAEEHEEDMRSIDATNYESFLDLLHELADACMNYPDSIWHAER